MRWLRVGEKWSGFGNVLKIEALGFAKGFSMKCERKKRQEYGNVFDLSNVMDGVRVTKM